VWARRAVVVLTVLLGAAYLWLRSPTAGPRVLFHGGTLLTMAEPAVAEAMLVVDGVITAVGDEEAVRAAAGDDVERVDLGGATLMPGLIEPHTHPIATAMLGQSLDVSGFTYTSRAEVMAALSEAASSFSLLEWVVAFGWDPVMVADLHPPTLAELDAISPERPLVVLTQMMHEAYANSVALAAAGITRDTPDPRGGAFGKDESGALNGTLREVGAITRLADAMPKPPTGVLDLLVDLQLSRYAQAGVTTLGVLGPVGRVPDPLGMLRRLGARDQSVVRLVVYALPDQLDEDDGPERLHPRLSLRGVKFWMDGSPFAGGAAWAEPYEDTSLVRDRLGLPPGHMAELTHAADDFEALFAAHHRRGFQVAVHAQGERAIDRVLDAVAASLEAHPREDHRHRLEHGALITEAQLRRARRLGVTVSFFIDHLYFYGDRLEQLVGVERLGRYMPLRSALEAGHRISIHTDNPATPIAPWRAIRTAVTRTPLRGTGVIAPDQTLTIEEALLAVTRDAAWQLGLEEEVGTLEVGKRADCVLLSHNPLRLETSRLTEIETLGTWIDGQPVDGRGVSGLGWRVIKGLGE